VRWTAPRGRGVAARPWRRAGGGPPDSPTVPSRTSWATPSSTRARRSACWWRSAAPRSGWWSRTTGIGPARGARAHLRALHAGGGARPAPGWPGQRAPAGGGGRGRVAVGDAAGGGARFEVWLPRPDALPIAGPAFGHGRRDRGRFRSWSRRRGYPLRGLAFRRCGRRTTAAAGPFEGQPEVTRDVQRSLLAPFAGPPLAAGIAVRAVVAAARAPAPGARIPSMRPTDNCCRGSPRRAARVTRCAREPCSPLRGAAPRRRHRPWRAVVAAARATRSGGSHSVDAADGQLLPRVPFEGQPEVTAMCQGSPARPFAGPPLAAGIGRGGPWSRRP